MNTTRFAVAGLPFMLGAGVLLGCSSGEPKSAPQGNQHAHGTKSPESLGSGHADHAGHGDAAELVVSTQPAKPAAGEPTTLKLMVHSSSGKMVNKFEETHTKLAHLIVVREGLDEFAHLHPDVDERGNMTVDHVFPKGGEYRLFLDHKPRGGDASTAKSKLQVDGDAPEAAKLAVTAPGQVSAAGIQANVTLEKNEKATIVGFDLADNDGKPLSDLRQYLGAMGHLVVISADGEQYVHAHPLTDEPGTTRVEFEVHFPSTGLYKMWGQFQRQDAVITIPAVMEVKSTDHAH